MPSRRPPTSRRGTSRVRKGTTKGTPPVQPGTNLDKLLFPAAGITKGDVLDYYKSISPHLLPHLKNRPMTLERLPDGLRDGAPHFWQKNTPAQYPKWIPRVTLKTEANKPVNYALVNDLATLLYLANQGTITFHSYFSTTDSLDYPDFVLFDLDVSEATFDDVITIAKQLRKQLDAQGMPSYPKTSGKRGLHILTPWDHKRGSYDAARAWATDIAQGACAALPDIATTARLKEGRGRRVYVDVIQNALGHHAVPPYVLRATPTATASTPLEWSEVNARLDPQRFTMKAVLERVKRKGDLMRDLVAK